MGIWLRLDEKRCGIEGGRVFDIKYGGPKPPYVNGSPCIGVDTSTNIIYVHNIPEHDRVTLRKIIEETLPTYSHA